MGGSVCICVSVHEEFVFKDKNPVCLEVIETPLDI